MTVPLLQVRDWQICFETNRTRTKNIQTHGLIPNKQDGEGYTMLLKMENGEAMYGAFHAMILLLSKQPSNVRNGWLTKDGTKNGQHYSTKDLAEKTKFTTSTIKEMLNVVVDIGWIKNHSSTDKKHQGGVGYPHKRVDLQFIIMAQNYHKILAKHFPGEGLLQKSNRAKTDLEGARELEWFHTKDEAPWSIKKIQDLIEWLPTNKFWRAHIRTLIGIRKISQYNNALKFENAHAQMETDFYEGLMNADQVEEDMHRNNLSDDDYDEIEDPNTGQKLWRRKS